MAIRMVKLIMISVFYIGRLDTPLFAPGVGHIGPVLLDSHHVQFRKDLLLHEAHRHPYMERLAIIYLLKLRYGDDFCNRAGGQWRLIFVLALMPWLRRYRLHDGPVYDGIEDEDTKPDASAEGEPAVTKDQELAKLRAYVKKLEEQLGNDDDSFHC